MTDEHGASEKRTQGGIGLYINRLVYGAVDSVFDSCAVMFRERELFLGVGLFFLGILNFNVGRYCDGNTAEYLSCTRPAVYYSFDALDIALIIIGIFLTLVWIIRDRRV